MTDMISTVFTFFGALTTLLFVALELATLALAVVYIKPRRPDVWVWIAGPALGQFLWSVVSWIGRIIVDKGAYSLLDYDVAAVVTNVFGLGFNLVDALLYGALLVGIAKLANPPAPGAAGSSPA
ncbi:MAG: hypothetical protein H6740_16365 [Alphaproteobacteria bacterium]|nr:hypothetical protein [Alphaproteobacteria bacterium]